MIRTGKRIAHVYTGYRYAVLTVVSAVMCAPLVFMISIAL
jgi:hypothetical protein